MGFFRQLGMLLRMSLLGVPQRMGLVCTTLIGVTCAVGVLVSMLAMGVGARRQLMGIVRPDRASLLSVGALQPAQSSIAKDTAVLIEELPGIRRNAHGQPIAVPQVFVSTQARAKGSGHRVSFPIIGNGAGFRDYAPELRLTSGRMFRPGLRELIASNYCARRYERLASCGKATPPAAPHEPLRNTPTVVRHTCRSILRLPFQRDHTCNTRTTRPLRSPMAASSGCSATPATN